jgi:hypothetical protein
MKKEILVSADIKFKSNNKRILGFKMNLDKNGEHSLLKISVIRVLLQSGFGPKDISIEHTERIGSKPYRADIYAKRGLEKLWFECGNFKTIKIKKLLKSFQGRIINVIHASELLDVLYGQSHHILLDKKMRNKSKKERIAISRNMFFIPKIEVWAVQVSNLRLVLAARRDSQNSYTFFRVPNGWSLSQWGYISNKLHRIEGLF